MSTLRKPMTPPTKIALKFRIGKCFFKIGRYNSLPILFVVETPISKANNIKVTIGAAELVNCNETR